MTILAANAKANEKRDMATQLRSELRSAPTEQTARLLAADFLEARDPRLQPQRLDMLLRAVKGFGRSSLAIRHLLTVARVPLAALPVSDLTDGEVERLVEALRGPWHPHHFKRRPMAAETIEAIERALAIDPMDPVPQPPDLGPDERLVELRAVQADGEVVVLADDRRLLRVDPAVALELADQLTIVAERMRRRLDQNLVEPRGSASTTTPRRSSHSAQQ